MDKKIYELYEALSIPKEKWPNYENPYDFTRNFHKCSLTEDVSTFTSDSTQLAERRSIVKH